MIEKLNEIRRQLTELLAKEDVDEKTLEELRIRFLGKKGELTAVLRGMGSLPPEERPKVGQYANELREEFERMLEEKGAALRERARQEKLERERIDVTAPGRTPKIGRRHPLESTRIEMCEIFRSMGFDIVEGPEVEYAYYNFDALNTPENHPSRDLTDTFYITENILLRTQTSPVQVRTMEQRKPPIKIVAPGRVYRSDEVDATHSPLFHQLEGLVVDKHITMGDLKGVLELFAQKMFGPGSRIRFRPHHFPFTEPPAEVDVSCFVCGGKGCPVCKGSGWLEIMGCGMMHPTVLRNGGYDPEVYSGFAAGMGPERISMLQSRIEDIRYFWANDLRFLEQF